MNVVGRSVKAVQGEILVKFAAGGAPSSESLSALSAYGASASGRIRGIEVFRYSVPDGELEKILEELNARPDILYAEPNSVYYAQALPPVYNTVIELEAAQWGLAKIQAPGAWDIETGNSKAIIAVVDSGVDLSHTDLAANIWVNTGETSSGLDSDGNGYIDDINGWDFVDGDNDPNPDVAEEWHGTHVAGISSASGSNGAAGLAYGSSIMALKVLSYRNVDGSMTVSGDTADIAEGIIYAADNGALIINMSLGADAPNSVLENAIKYASNAGVILVGASGNANDTIVYWPAAYAEVIAVGASDKSDNRADFGGGAGSNYGSALELMAPGVDIRSTMPGGGYANSQGTSMAAPFVSGLAALAVSYYEEKNQSWDGEMIRDLLIRHADGLSGGGYPYRDSETGYGRINAQTMMTFIDAGGFRVDPSEPLSYPNPFNPELQTLMLVLSSGNTSEVREYKIFSLSGRLVRNDSGLSGTFARWDGRNNDGSLCAPGLYFYQLSTYGGDNERGKITLVR